MGAFDSSDILGLFDNADYALVPHWVRADGAGVAFGPRTADRAGMNLILKCCKLICKTRNPC